MLEKTGAFNKAVAVIPSTKLQEGDILVTRTKGHTVIVIEAESEDKPAHKPDKAKAEKSKKRSNMTVSYILCHLRVEQLYRH